MRRYFLLFALSASSLVHAQQVATGIYQWGSFDSKGFDSINLANLNTHFSIPVFAKSGRGGMDFHYNLVYDSAVWTPVNSGASAAWQPSSTWGWTADTNAVTGYFTYNSQMRKCFDSPPGWYWSTIDSNFNYVDQMGIVHYFPGTTSDCSSYGSENITVNSSDGSGYTLNAGIGTFSLTDPRGHYIDPPINATGGTGSVTDSNGNQTTTTLSGIVDTTGTTVLALSGTGTPTSPRTFTYPVWESPTSGTTSGSVAVSYSSYNVLTAFGCSGIGEYSTAGVNLVSSVTLADGEVYSFSYEPTPGAPGNITGRLQTITLPTGGIITYAYSGGSNGIVCADGGTATLTRTMTSSSGTPSWTYVRTPGSTEATSHTDVTDGMSSPNSSSYDFISDIVDDPTYKYYATSHIQYQGSASGTPLLSDQTCYNGSAAPCTTQAITVPITSQVITSTYNGSQTKKTAYSYTNQGLITEEDDYDFGASGPGSLLQKTVTQYATYLTGITGLIGDVLLYDGNGDEISGVAYTYDQSSVTSTSGLPNHVAVYNSRGNVTSSSLVNPLPQVSPTTTTTYDDAGQVLTSTDSNGNQTSFGYDTGTDTFVMTATLPAVGGITHQSASSWDIGSGIKKTDTDMNSNITSYTYDVMLRPASVNSPDGGIITAAYSLTSSSPYTSVSILHATGSTITQATYLDPYGRPQETSTTDSPSPDLVDTAYDGNGNVYSISNPYRSGTPLYTYYYYDGLGRNTSATETDGSSISDTYSGNTDVHIDEASHKRELIYDGVGRVSTVWEPDSSNNLTLETDYLYHQNYVYSSGTGISYQTIVEQKGGTTDSTKWRTRTFTFDPTGRVLSENTPEAGTTSYSYASYSSSTASYSILCSGNYSAPCTRTDANSTLTTYAYDALNRLTGKTYGGSSIGAATPSISYYYDQPSYNGLTIANAIGEPTGMSDGSGATAWSFDPVGRISAIRKTINGYTKQSVNSYNPDGSLNQLTDFAGNVYTYTYDSTSGLPTGVYDGAGNTYASGALYNAAGQLTNLTHQLTSTSAAFTRSVQYNSRQQPYIFQASAGGSQIYNLQLNYPSGADNGNVSSTVNGLNSGRNLTYTYDYLNRVIEAHDAWNNFGEDYVYDNWGNLYQRNLMSSSYSSAFQFTALVDNKNHLSNLAYDSAGQMTQDQLYTGYSYDAEGRLIQVGTENFVYDGAGNRVEQSNSGGWNALYWSNGANVLDQSDSAATTFYPMVYFGERRIWLEDWSGEYMFLFQDQLGSTRVDADSYSGVVYDDWDYTPFGNDNGNSSWGGSVNSYLFTGNESDGFGDNLNFRELDWVTGRFNRSDPYDGSYDLTNPQSLNRYSYVMNSPMRYVDPMGLDPLCTDPATMAGGVCLMPGDDSAGIPATMVNGVWTLSVYAGTTNGGLDIPTNFGNDSGFLALDEPITSISSFGISGGGGRAPNNGRNCSAGPASAGQYIAATAEAATLTSQWGSGLGPGDRTFGPNTATSAVMGQSAGVQDVLNQYYMLGRTNDLYTFGAVGYAQAGANPVAQFVGSFRWSISGGVLSLTNTTSFKSLTYDVGPQWQRSSFRPMGNTHQTYQIGITCH